MKNGNEPAFAAAADSNENVYRYIQLGLTKREYFAAMALQGLLSNPNYPPRHMNISTYAVHSADALLAELEKTDK